MNRKKQQAKRQVRIRKKMRAVSDLPRLSVFRSNQHVYAQIIDDAKRVTLLGVSEKVVQLSKGTKTERAHMLGQALAKMAQEKKIKQVIFDKGSYAYHGRIKAVAEGAREGGLQF